MRRKFKRLTAFLLSAAMILPFFTEYPEGTFDLDWSVSAAEALTDNTTGVTLSDSDGDDYYDIGTADELYAFANIVNNGNNTVNAELTQNITVNSGDLSTYNGTDSVSWREWTPIDNSSNRYTGIFDGNNKTISGLYFNDSEQNYVGLFGCLGDGEIKNVGVVNSYFNGKHYVGGVCGDNYEGTITNCYNTGTVSGDSDVGGVCGINCKGTITNCYNTGTVVGVDFVGGVCGYNTIGDTGSYTITNCYNTGNVTATGDSARVGGVCGYNFGCTITNCYYDNTVYTGNAVGNNYNGTLTSVAGKSTDQFASGEVAYLLNGSTSTGELVWGQTLTGENAQACPVLGGAKVYYGYTACNSTEKSYSNSEIGNEKPQHIFEEDSNGLCTVCGKGYKEPAQDANSVYQIANAGNLMWFAQQVNEGQTAISAKLTADIAMNGIDWTIMSSFAGTFDGNGYTISGLNGHIDMWAQVQCHGFIRTLNNGGFVKNLTFTGAKVFNHEGSGAISAIIVYTNQGTVENCAVKDSNIHHGGYDALGVVVGVNSGTIRNCASISNTMTRRFSSTKDICGFVWSNSGSIENCFNYDCTYQNGSNRYAFTQSNTGTITNCYYYESSETISDTAVTSKTADQFAGGEVAYLLNGDQTTIVWGQTLTGENAQAYPVLNGDKVYRYESVKCDSSSKDPAVYGYSNEEKSDVIDEHNVDSNGFCTVCGKGYKEPAQDANGVYQISNAGELYWFAGLVNGTLEGVAQNRSANAVLTADIVVNSDEKISSYNGTDSVSWRPWTPIGNNSNRYTGTFDGNNKTISGLYFNNSEQNYVGLFGFIGSNAKIKNVGVVNSYYKGNDHVGGVCGKNYTSTITNCYNTGNVSATNEYAYVGGVCGDNYGGTITNCYNTGSVTATGDSAYGGGVCGDNYNGTIENCYYDNIVYTGNAVGHNYNGTLTSVEGKSTDQFASGEVAYLLNGSSSENVTWYQKLLTDTYPVLDSKHGKVYSIFECDGSTPAGYSNENMNEPHIDDNGDEYCDNCGVIYNGIGAHLAGYSVSLNGSIGVNFHMDLTQDVLDDNEAYMLFTLPNGTSQKVMVSDAKAKESAVIEGKTYYIFTCNVAAKEMTDKIQAQLITSDGSKTQVYEYSVREYADRILEGSYDYETQELVKAMLHYGAYSQEWFGYNTTNLANDGLDNLDLSDADNLDGFDPAITNNEKVGSFTSAYLTLESDTAINLKFKLADGVSFEDLRVVVQDPMANVVPVTTVTTENVCLITLTGIKASDLDTTYSFSVTDGESNKSTILYSAMSYACAVADSEMDQKLKDVTAALRIFNLRANEKFE